ncbi:hypothetical protein RB195_021693 [Necator americanus]|uniref:Uncharacterized protein n=1 Tax=Necator americanus TaxID=51031 RepID=A0ABR1ECK5_NECAM
MCVTLATDDFSQEKRLRRRFCRQQKRDRENEWTSRAKEFEKVLDDRNPRKPYILARQKRKRKDTTVSEDPPSESEVPVCIQKTKNGKSGRDDGIWAGMLKSSPPSGIREMTKIIRSIWIDEMIPHSCSAVYASPGGSRVSRAM